MNEQLDQKYIGDAIDELAGLLGVKEEIPSETIVSPIHSGDLKLSLQRMASYLGLPIRLDIVCVPATHGAEGGGNSFTTSALVKTDQTGRGTESITAQVLIPQHLPFYGSEPLRGFPITVRISENCQKYPAALLGIMAHELSHVLLHALLSPKKDNEVYTDLAAIILGFSNVMKEGRRVVEVKRGYNSTTTTTTTYGYLSNDGFDFALDRVSRIRADKGTPKRQLLGRLGVYVELVSSYRKKVRAFAMFMEYLDENVSRKAHKADGTKLVELHQIDYGERLNRTLEKHELESKKIDKLCGELVHYTPKTVESLREAIKVVGDWTSRLERESQLLDSDLAVLRRNTSFSCRVKVNRLVHNAGADNSARL